MHLLLLRHGQTDENARGILQGHSQTRLNALGHEQARSLAGRLRTFAPPVEALVTSDLMRAVQTAAAIEATLGLRAQRLEAWRERGFGPFEGRLIGEADTWRAAAGHWDLPGAETTAAFQARVQAAFDDTVRAYAAVSCLAVVTHGAVLRNILSLFGEGRLRLAADEPLPAPVPIVNCAIMHLEAGASHESVVTWRVRAVNDVDHLGAPAATAFRVEQ